MKISSLFKDKAYAFTDSSNPDDDCAFATKILQKIKPNFKVKDIIIQGVKDHCDVFLVLTDKDKLLKVKISLSDPEKLLKKEATGLRSVTPKIAPKLVSYGSIKVGENIDYLIIEVSSGESIRNYGRSGIIENLDLFLDSYWKLSKTRPVKQSYKKLLLTFTDKLLPHNCLPEQSLEAVKNYTDYPLCENLLLTLRTEIKENLEQIKDKLNIKCHGSLCIDSIFYNGDSFYFDDLYNVSMGHPYIDFVDLTLELGVAKEDEIRLLNKFCKAKDFPLDMTLYSYIYNIQLRKKLGELLVGYITEVYLYDSYRYEKILAIADTFAHCYEKFCTIEIFKENRDFVMKTICEPIFGVKP